MSFPVLTSQRFFRFRLSELFDLDSAVVEEYIEEINTVKMLADSIIIDIDYPFYLGSPDDTHLYNCFHGDQKWCKRIDADYWQTSKETLSIRVGDCEDSSIAFVACARQLGLKFDEVYEIFGVVRDAETGSILGGHGWSVFKDEEGWHLVESTLDCPPEEYPIVPDIFKDFQFENITYCPEWIFNDTEFHRVKEVTPFQVISMPKRKKETREKYEAIEKAWMTSTKPHKAFHRSFWAKVKSKLKRR